MFYVLGHPNHFLYLKWLKTLFGQTGTKKMLTHHCNPGNGTEMTAVILLKQQKNQSI
jgi:hypothetical protein